MSSAEQAASGDRTGPERAAGHPGGALSLRLAAFFFVTSLLLLSAGSAILYAATVSVLQSADDQVARKRLNAIADILQRPQLDSELVAHEVSEDIDGPRQIFIRVVTPFAPLNLETPSMSERLPPASFPVVSSAPLNDERRATFTTSNGSTFRALARRVPVAARPGPETAIIQVATDTTLDATSIALFRRILAAVIGAAVPLCALASWGLVRRELKPLEKITQAAEAVTGRTLDRQIKTDGLPDELHRLATQFNLMLHRLDRSYTELRGYADNLAHELRTPLSRIRLRCELALRQSASGEASREALLASVEDCESLTRLLEQLLFVARAEHGQARASFAALNVSDAFQRVLDFFEASADAAGVTLSKAADPALVVMGDRQLLQRAIANLVSNALDHARCGDAITLGANRSDGTVTLTVRDTGPGMPAEYVSRIFDRFFRVPQAADAKDGEQHLGLGLAITKSIVEMHKGTIDVETAPGAGTAFHISLPASEPASVDGGRI